jgi:hypothetical protein
MTGAGVAKCWMSVIGDFVNYHRKTVPAARLLWKAPTCTMSFGSSFGRTTWPSRAQRVGLTTFFQNLDQCEPAARDCAAYLNPHLKEVS